MSILTKNPIQHWLDTPVGSYRGYPEYGNSIYELIGENRQDLNAKLGIIIDKMEDQLGTLVAMTIKSIYFAEEKDKRDTFYIVIELINGKIALGEYGNV